MKAQNPNLKTLVAIGGYNEALITPWYTLAASAAARQNFARNLREFIARNYLDGVGKIYSVEGIMIKNHRGVSCQKHSTILYNYFRH